MQTACCADSGSDDNQPLSCDLLALAILKVQQLTRRRELNLIHEVIDISKLSAPHIDKVISPFVLDDAKCSRSSGLFGWILAGFLDPRPDEF